MLLGRFTHNSAHSTITAACPSPWALGLQRQGRGQSRLHSVMPWAGRESLSSQDVASLGKLGPGGDVRAASVQTSPGQESAFSQVRLRKSNYIHFLWKEKEWIQCRVPSLVLSPSSVVIEQGSSCSWAKCIGANLMPITGALPHPSPSE